MEKRPNMYDTNALGGLRPIARMLCVPATTLQTALKRHAIYPITLGDDETSVYVITECQWALANKGPAGKKSKAEREAKQTEVLAKKKPRRGPKPKTTDHN